MSGAFGVSSVNPLLSDLLVPADQAIEVIAPGGRWAGPDPKRPGSGHTRTLSSPRKGSVLATQGSRKGSVLATQGCRDGHTSDRAPRPGTRHHPVARAWDLSSQLALMTA